MRKLYTSKIFVKKILFTIILLYPTTYLIEPVRSVGGAWSNIFFFLILLLYFLLGNLKIRISKPTLTGLGILLILFLLTIINFNSFRLAKPTFFIFYISLVFIWAKQTKYFFYEFKEYLILLLLFIPFFLLLSNNYYYMGRFTGFSLSPTTFSMFITSYVVIGFYLLKTKFSKTIIFLAGGMLVYFTQTRLNLFLFLLIPPLYLIGNSSKTMRVLVLITVVFTLNFVYTIYNLVKAENPDLISYRYKDDEYDRSFRLRNTLFNESIAYWKNLSTYEKIKGAGSEKARENIYNIFKRDLFPHNDFVRILIDFGLIFFICFILFFISIGSKNVFSFLLTILYFIGFYHNMIFDYFLVSLVIISTSFVIPINIKKRWAYI